MAKWSDELLNMAPYDPTAYQTFDLNRLAVFVIATLQERRLPITFEAFTVAAFKMFPTKFSLIEFPEFPDAARANRALLQLRPKYRNWATGDVQRGFVLTDGGKRILAEVREALHGGAAPTRPGPRETPSRSKDLASDLRDVESSGLFETWQTESHLASDRPDDVYALLGAYPGVPKRALRDRLELLRTTAEHAGHETTAAFLVELRRLYRSLFQEID